MDQVPLPLLDNELTTLTLEDTRLIAEALAEAQDSPVVSFAAFEAWVGSLGTANELPLPEPDTVWRGSSR